jgi:hypothetical protein
MTPRALALADRALVTSRALPRDLLHPYTTPRALALADRTFVTSCAITA